MFILSYEFTVVFLIFFLIYWACKQSIKLQNLLLITAGFLYVMSLSFSFAFSLIVMWQVTQISALSINRVTEHKHKKIILLIGLIILVGHLCFFKYSNFFIDEINAKLNFDNGLEPLDIIIPLGLSFYTFQAISYLVDVYKDRMKPLPSPVAFGFLSFVPTLTSGPIFRAQDAIKQWQPEGSETWQTPTENQRQIIQPYLVATLICLALLKKLVLAGWLQTIWVTPIFSNPLQFNGTEVLVGVYAYAFQLFFDFSAYTDLAIAVGLLLGFRLPENFNRPYLATNIREFWSRWHITLSTWIRDYLYIPLGGNQGGFIRVQTNLFIAFALSGIWHGAGWNFLIWGVIHAVAMIALNVMRNFGYHQWISKKSKAFAIFLTFNYVCFGWIFFNTQTLEQAQLVMQGLVNFSNQEITLPLFTTVVVMILGWWSYAAIKDVRTLISQTLQKLPLWLLPVALTLYVLLVFSIAPDGLPGFIYANF